MFDTPKLTTAKKRSEKKHTPNNVRFKNFMMIYLYWFSN